MSYDEHGLEDDLMRTDYGAVEVNGYGEMKRRHKTRSIILKALTNLQIRAWEGEPNPTQQMILEESIRLGSGLSPTSGQTVNRHLNNLISDGHISKRENDDRPGALKGRGRGGIASPWVSFYAKALIDKRRR